MMKYLKKFWAIVVLIILLLQASSAFAVGVTTPPATLPDAPLVITAYYFDDIDPASTVDNRVNYIEIYNDSDQPVRARDWSLTIQWSLETSPPAGATLASPVSMPLASGDEYIAPKNYIVLSFGNSVSGATVEVSGALSGGLGNYVSSVSLASDGYTPYEKGFTSPETEPKRLKQTTTGYTTTGTYSAEDRSSLYDNGWYEIGVDSPASFPFGPIEILAHPKSCAPLDTSLACGDYVKFYNATTVPVSFDGTRLRIGYQGQSISTANAIPLTGTIQPGQYTIINQTITGSPLSIANSGGYVWLEDTYGLMVYSNTIVEYDDASSSTHQGESWANIDGAWGWAVPSPDGANTSLPVESSAVATTSTLTPCRSDQYRNPLTNRCKLIASATTSVKPCAANQYRNPETNRCKAIAVTASSLKACVAGQIRNPLTNRCKKSASSLLPTADFPVKEIPDSQNSPLGWVAFASVGSAAVGYGLWEWRRELSIGYKTVLKWLKP